MLLSVKASQNNFYDILEEIMHALVSIVGKWSLLPPTIGVNSHSHNIMSAVVLRQLDFLRAGH